MIADAAWDDVVAHRAGNWQWITNVWVYDVGENWHWVNEANVWIYVYDPVEGTTPVEMVFVEGGTFPLGTGYAGSAVLSFYASKFEVTWGQWKEVRTWAANNGYDIGSVGAGCANDHPAHMISWIDVLKWCNAKSELEGLAPVYTFAGSVFRDGQPEHTLINQSESANGYRLPQSKEWAFAARGGNQSMGYTYAGSNDLNEVGWYLANSSGAACGTTGTWPVGLKLPNELGLYDMSGNVFEWCWDFYLDFYRTVRGGSFVNNPDICTVNGGSMNSAGGRFVHTGFRLFRNADQ